ncbi:MAG: serine hydrolase domain-containing protein [Gammaproteobacteria bacterium]|nr:MAG: class C beta-lactamase-related serine hydrolase [Gammaproteobacteria bacterium TMED186]|tara:strand:- start:2598 stop:3797 length:1200 start_codon:yes stop_codon:yes gene_type:complete
MKIFSITLLVVALIAAFVYGPGALRVYRIMHLYDEDKIANNFINMNKLFTTSEPIQPSSKAKPLPKSDKPFSLPSTFYFEDKDQDLNAALKHFKTDGLLIIKEGEVVYEEYFNGNSQTTRHISWSVAKSFLSSLVGIAVNDGLIDDINDPITKYLPDFKNTGYDGIKIKNILQMSSGVLFNEDYADPNSDINKFGVAIARGTSFRDFAKTLTKDKEQGTYNHYVSIDSQMLGLLLDKVTGMPLREYLQMHIWEKIGMEDEAYYLADNEDVDLALGGLNATLRDYAKFGLLYLNKGKWDNEQVVPEAWVDASHAMDLPHLQPGAGDDLSSSDWGYGYQWWVPGFPNTDYTASGVYNQYIYVDPVTETVIAKISSNHRFTAEKEYSKAAHVAMFRAIAQTQ